MAADDAKNAETRSAPPVRLVQKMSLFRTETLALEGDKLRVSVRDFRERSEFCVPLHEVADDYVEWRVSPGWAEIFVAMAVLCGGGLPVAGAVILAVGTAVFLREICPGRKFWRFGSIVFQVHPPPIEGDVRSFVGKMLDARHEAWKKEAASRAPLIMMGLEISIAEEIRALHELVGMGVITRDEFEAKKTELLGRLDRYVPTATDD